MSRLALGCALIGAFAAAPAQAEPLTFGAINGRDQLSRSAEVGACRSQPAGGKSCLLNRRSFGGLPIGSATIALNAAGRAQSVDILLDGADYDVAHKLLVGRYGRPITGPGLSRWGAFDDRATIAIGTSARNTIISFRFPANEAVVGVSRLQTTPIIALSPLAALAFAIGLVLRKRRGVARARPVPAATHSHSGPEPSMRATLERRMRAGEI